jgi:GAF domain-containing protein
MEGSPVGDVARSGWAKVDEEVDTSEANFEYPPAVVPLRVDDQVVGVIAIFATLAQKQRFDTTDFELFKLLGQHAAAALVSASLFAKAERRLPGLEAFLDVSI